MQLPELIDCRLRNAFTTTIASTFLISLLLCLGHASTTNSITQEDHNHHRLLELQSETYGTLDHDPEFEEGNYESEFLGVDRSIIGRADDTPTTLENNYPGKDNIDSGKRVWKYPKKELTSRSSQVSAARLSSAEQGAWDSIRVFDDYNDSPLKPRQAGTTLLHITLNICDQPLPKTANTNGAPSPLQLYVSTDSDNQSPDKDNNNYEVPIMYGYGVISLNVTGDVYLSVVTPEKSKQFDGIYSYELTGSTDSPYTTYVDDATMLLVDSDTGAALLSSKDATNTSMYGVFVHPQDDPTILGLSRSFCGLRNWARIKGNINDLSTGDVDTGLMILGGNETKQQFYVKNLNGSSAYYGFIALNGTSTGSKLGAGNVGGGGKVWKPMNFTTKVSDNCAVIYNLTFCSDVAYAVPANNTKYNQTELSKFYDNDAKDKYQNFNKSLSQIPCDTTSSAQYSLARNCTDCANAYKTWLCAVTIPRCEDFSSSADYLMPRLVSQTFSNESSPHERIEAPLLAGNKSAVNMSSSRNSRIDTDIRPGPYKEVLPCTNLCYEIVRSCPASLQFSCPLEKHGLYYAYGENKTDMEVTCNYPGAPFRQSIASGISGSSWVAPVALLMVLANAV